jgi:glycerol 3-phosphatase-2
VRPHVVGKPAAALFDLARSRLGAHHAETLVCGDRLDTDIQGANAAGLDSLFVLSGASRLQDLACAPQRARPTYVAADLTGLLEPGVRLDAEADDLVELTPDAALRIRDVGDSGRLLQAVVATAWAALDAGRAVSDDAGMWRRLEGHLGLETG